MPSTKVLSKPTPPKTKVKRKRVEEPSDVAPTQTTVEKPTKKSRRDDTSSIPSNPPADQEAKASAKSTKKVKSKKSVDTAKPPTETKETKQGKAKTVAFAKTAPNDSQAKRKTKNPLRNAKPPVPVEDEANKADASAAADAQEEEEIHLQGFSSESDSSDEEMDVGDASPLDMSKLPVFSKDDAVVQRKLEKARKNPSEDRGVIYLGRIPHGFYEDQMRTYFCQFGDVTRLRLSRNKKTGQSKHYAFIEFSSSAVAEIVSETMDNYLLLGHILKCKVIPKDQVHAELWVGANKKWRMIPRDRIARVKQNKPRTDEEQLHAESKLLARQKKKQSKISALGIDYDFTEVAYKRNIQEPVGVVSPT